MFERVIEAFGSLDILVNNAGIQHDAELTEMTLQQRRRTLFPGFRFEG